MVVKQVGIEDKAEPSEDRSGKGGENPFQIERGIARVEDTGLVVVVRPVLTTIAVLRTVVFVFVPA